ncbi:MAG: insulinase family protein [Thermoplasmata archaeon]|nr:insulinase family protein [Thermoplasmata archaeon]
MSDRADPLAIERTVRSDGLEIVRQSSPPGTASFSATYLGPAGFAYDPSGREGTASVTSHLLTSGAGRWDRLALARELDRLGASLSTRCDPESSGVTVWGPASSSRRLMELLAASVLHPRFAARDLERVRRQLLERQLQEETQPDSRAERVLFETVFPVGHPYRLSGVGTRRSVQKISRVDVVRFHRAQFTSANGLVLVTGPGTLEAVAREVRRVFSGFQTEAAPGAPPAKGSASPPKRPMSIAMEGRSQVEVLVGGPSIARADPRFAAVHMANEVLGGRSMLNRLFQRVRETNGLAYHASSEVEAMRWGGYWTAQAGTGPKRVARVIEMVEQEVDRISEELIPASELDQIRESAIGQIPLQVETTSGAHELGLDLAYHHLPGSFYRDWPGTLRALTRAQVRRGAESGINRRGAVTVVAGPTH